jgi:hypothetical protein
MSESDIDVLRTSKGPGVEARDDCQRSTSMTEDQLGQRTSPHLPTWNYNYQGQKAIPSPMPSLFYISLKELRQMSNRKTLN